MNVHWSLPCDVSSVGDARWALRGLLAEAGSPVDESDAAAMVITELLANAIVHSERESDQIEVVIESTDSQLHIEVVDHNTSAPGQRAITLDAASGRGLRIVEALSSAWGWDHVDGDGNRVWCDVPRSGEPPGRTGGSLPPDPAPGIGRPL
jgi:anti-sigma regulatory factor (Ser/Thr protein kinase)